MDFEKLFKESHILCVFMGADYKNDMYYPTTECPTIGGGIIGKWVNELRYNSSWDWLMPVWVKLQDFLKEDGTQGGVYAKIGLLVAKGKIEDAYPEIVEGVKWYNDKISNDEN